MPLNRWDGSSWVGVSKADFSWWDGSAWQEPAQGYYWDGSAWQAIWATAFSGDDIVTFDRDLEGLYGIERSNGSTIWSNALGLFNFASFDYMGGYTWMGYGDGQIRKINDGGNVVQTYDPGRGGTDGFYTALDSDPARAWIFVAFNSGDGGVGAYEEDVDVLGNPILTEHWHTHTNNEVGESCSFDATNDKVFFANRDANELWRLDAGTGTLETSVALPDLPWNVEATANSEVYVSVGFAGKVHKFDTNLNEDTSGWPFDGFGAPDSLITDDTYIYVGTREARVHKVDRSGVEQWSVVMGDGTITYRIQDLRVYPNGDLLVSADAFLRLLDSAGNTLWTATDPSDCNGVTTEEGRHNSGKGW